MNNIRGLMLLLLVLIAAPAAYAQCGALAYNVFTGELDCTGPAGAGTGTVTSVTVAGTANQITATGTCTGTTTISCTLSVPSDFRLPGTINRVTLTQPATGVTITITDGKTVTVGNTLTFTGTDGSSVAFGTGGTVLYTTGNAATATALAADPTDCSAGSPAIGINAGGTAQGCITLAAVATSGSASDLGSGTLPNARLGSNVVRTDQANTGGAAMTLDLSASTNDEALRVPNVAGAANTSEGAISFDPTNDNFHGGANGADNILAMVLASGIPANDDCAKFSLSSNRLRLTSAGAACGSGGGGGTAGASLFSSVNATGAGPDNTGTETSLIPTPNTGSLTIPANTWVNGTGMNVEASGIWTTPAASTDTVVFRVKCGTTALAASAAVNVSTLGLSMTNQQWQAFFQIGATTSGTTGLLLNNAVVFTTNTLVTVSVPLINTAVTAYDITTSCAFDFTADFSGATSGESIKGTNIKAYVPGAVISSVAVDGSAAGTGVVSLGGTATYTSNQTQAQTDCGKTIILNGSSVTLTLAATPVAKCRFRVLNLHATVATIARNGLNINGLAANLVLGQYTWAGVSNDGTNYFSENGMSGLDIQTFTSNGTWTKPTWGTPKMVKIIGCGGGGGGGGGVGTTASRAGGTGGGGGFCGIFDFLATDLAATVAVTVPSASAGGAEKLPGTAGGNVTFGAHATFFGGGGGFGQATSANVAGGGGGGAGAVGGTGAAAAVSGGFPVTGTNVVGIGGGGAGSTTNAAGKAAEWGGGSGGGAGAGGGAGSAGGSSIRGAGGGGGGGGMSSGDASFVGGAGGDAGTYQSAGGGGGAGGAAASGSNNGNVGSNGADGDTTKAGEGGGGGSGGSGTGGGRIGGVGGNGGTPGGGGGGGGGGDTGGAGGNGGPGKLWVLTVF